MSLASPVFKAMLGPNFKEGQALQANGKVEISLDDEAFSFVILANVFHHKASSVTIEANLDLLFKVARLVDKYQMREAAEFFYLTWIEKVKGRTSPSFCEPSMLGKWLEVAWIFRDNTVFEDVSHVITMQAEGRFEDVVENGTLIPHSVIG